MNSRVDASGLPACTTPKAIPSSCGRQLLDEAHYVRYDFSTATKLLDVYRELKQRYGSMTA